MGDIDQFERCTGAEQGKYITLWQAKDCWRAFQGKRLPRPQAENARGVWRDEQAS
jgi:hypothetical protein